MHQIVRMAGHLALLAREDPVTTAQDGMQSASRELARDGAIIAQRHVQSDARDVLMKRNPRAALQRVSAQEEVDVEAALRRLSGGRSLQRYRLTHCVRMRVRLLTLQSEHLVGEAPEGFDLGARCELDQTLDADA